MADAIDDELDELDPDEEARFDKYLERTLEKRRTAAQRREAPKDFGEMMDRFRDEIADVLESDFGLERKSERRELDEPPSRSGGGGGRKREAAAPTFGDRFFGLVGKDDDAGKGRRSA